MERRVGVLLSECSDDAMTEAPSTRPLDGAVALVTGASSGIGEATATTVAELGASVVAVARRRERLDALAKRITDAGGRAEAIVADITDPDQIAHAVSRTVEAFGRLDIVIANAGQMLLGPIEGAPLEEWDRMVRLNLVSAMKLSHAALPHLLAAAADGPRQVADLVLVSSVAGRVAEANFGAYNATKFGLNAFGESLRQEVARRHVRVGLVEPGAVRTELATHNREDVRATLKDRFGGIEAMLPHDIADGIGFMVTRPRRAAVNELLIRPTEQL
jgi:NADP-dependent 3-hydroxy acid dehydrogenase YdfG